MTRTFSTRTLLPAAALAAIFGLTACAGSTGGPSTGSGTGTEPSGDAAPSADASAEYVTEGKLTVATGQPAYGPWVIDDAPESGEGFEAAVAYAVAEELGFAEEDVVWVRTTFDEAIAPGPKDFDFNLQQFSISDERKEAVDFSSPYYETAQVVVATGSSPAADAASLADLKPLLIGAQTGTTSLEAVETVIAPEQGAQVFNSNDDAKLALESGTIDALVVDLPTAFFLRDAELSDGVIVGQLPADDTAGDQLGLVLEKDSPLTDDVTAAVDALRESGRLQELADEWLTNTAEVPVLE
jgi:polar amino acid transport system substrate-binding protein